MKIEKAGGSDFEGIITDAGNYEGKSNILKFHTKGRGDETTRQRGGVNIQSCDRGYECWCGLRELHAPARFTILRPPPKPISAEKEDFSENERRFPARKQEWFRPHTGLFRILQGNKRMLPNEYFKENKKTDPSKTHLRCEIWYFRKKAIRKLKGGVFTK